MKFRLILSIIIVAAVFSSCSSVYRSGQTPDDVYFSPARETDSYVRVDSRDDNRYSRNNYDSYDDRWLRMRVRNRLRWSAFDDYYLNDWRYNTWSYNYYNPYGWNTYWNNYYSWNSFYNPYCHRVIVVSPKVNPQVYTKLRNFSLASYTNTKYSIANTRSAKSGIRLSPNSNYNNSNSFGSALRKVFSGNSNNNSYTPSSSSSRPSRTYTPPSTSGSSSSGSRSSGSSSSGSSSGGGVSRPTRGGGK